MLKKKKKEANVKISDQSNSATFNSKHMTDFLNILKEHLPL